MDLPAGDVQHRFNDLGEVRRLVAIIVRCASRAEYSRSAALTTVYAHTRLIKSHWDQFAKIYEIGYCETRINGKPVGLGMTCTPAQCQDMLVTRFRRLLRAPDGSASPSIRRSQSAS
jgi:hypothetical protein